MAITKIGEQFVKEAVDLPAYINRLVSSIHRGAKYVGTTVIPKLKPPAVIVKPLTWGIKGITNTGKWIYQNPKIAVPLAVGAGVGGYKLQKNIRPRLYHVDPEYNVTNEGPFGGISYNETDDPRLKDYLRKKSLYTI